MDATIHLFMCVMSVLNANIRTFKSHAESPKLHNLFFLWHVPGQYLEQAGGNKGKPDLDTLRRKRGSP